VLLALDTATPAVTVAVHDGVAVLSTRHSVEVRRHAEVLAPLLAQVLAEAGVRGPELSEVLVGVGPGAYTGLRVGLATAQALGLAWGVPVHGVCTLDALAAQAVTGQQLAGGLLVVTDARRGQVFWARYGPDGARRSGPAVDDPSVVEHRDLPAVGAGALAWPELFPRARAPEHPDAGWLAQAVLDGVAPRLPLEPLYLRQPDAARPGPAKRVLQDGRSG
jgi:tRNA threonylcarbamoyladenosine biosynthesis protein TsaB